MEFAEEACGVRKLCVAKLGEAEGEKLAAMALPGFRLTPARPGKPASGLCRRGGPALLDPGTPWPEYGGLPLSLSAVLDTEVLAPWLGDILPCRPGLLNFFYLQPGPDDADAVNSFFEGEFWQDPEAGCVIAADPARAVEIAAPAFAELCTPLHAERVVTMPDPSDDDIDKTYSQICFEWHSYEDRAFGWPTLELSQPLHPKGNGDPYTHLLQLQYPPDEPGYSDGGLLHFTIPTPALQAGDFTQATSTLELT
ncbi:DUF1963 domain-containing protein [Streptomyces violaceusniger]|uniref:DUF1963 domain-containing protein n=1 Tax=Streptomyces violaceusniger TaxID=68280 RepID=UPI0009969435